MRGKNMDEEKEGRAVADRAAKVLEVLPASGAGDVLHGEAVPGRGCLSQKRSRGQDTWREAQREEAKSELLTLGPFWPGSLAIWHMMRCPSMLTPSIFLMAYSCTGGRSGRSSGKAHGDAETHRSNPSREDKGANLQHRPNGRTQRTRSRA